MDYVDEKNTKPWSSSDWKDDKGIKIGGKVRTSKALMAHVLKGSQFYLHTLRSSANGMNHIPAFTFPAELVLIYRPRRDGRLSWPWVAGCFTFQNKCLTPGIESADRVAHLILSTNRARR